MIWVVSVRLRDEKWETTYAKKKSDAFSSMSFNCALYFGAMASFTILNKVVHSLEGLINRAKWYFECWT